MRELARGATSIRQRELLRSAMDGITCYLEDPEVVEIMVNPDQTLWVEKVGKEPQRKDSPLTQGQIGQIIHLIASHSGGEIHRESPSISTKLPQYGVRVQAFLPPIVEGPTLIFRKHAPRVFSLKEYCSRGMLSQSQCESVMEAVMERKNILIAGGTGSGKTTFANALLDIMATQQERIYMVEDNPELQCASENRLEILVQPPIYDYRRAIFDALRSRPDRIIVGEVRDGSALELLKAWNTGHPGGIATIHANGAVGALDRMCQLIEEVVDKAPRDFVADAVDLVVFITKDKLHPAGRRVSEVVGVEGITPDGAWMISHI